MKKWVFRTLLGIGILMVSGHIGYNYLINMAANKISQELSKVLRKIRQFPVNLNDQLFGEINSPRLFSQQWMQLVPSL